jgi:hypothetical protein
MRPAVKRRLVTLAPAAASWRPARTTRLRAWLLALPAVLALIATVWSCQREHWVYIRAGNRLWIFASEGGVVRALVSDDVALHPTARGRSLWTVTLPHGFQVTGPASVGPSSLWQYIGLAPTELLVPARVPSDESLVEFARVWGRHIVIPYVALGCVPVLLFFALRSRHARRRKVAGQCTSCGTTCAPRRTAARRAAQSPR